MPVASVPELAIQEYINRPTVLELVLFFKYHHGNLSKTRFGKESTSLCKRLLGQFRQITREEVTRAHQELNQVILEQFKAQPRTYLHELLSQSNVVVVGWNARTQKVRLAIVDRF